MAADLIKLRLERALLPNGFADDVLVSIRGGVIEEVVPRSPAEADETARGVTLPGMPNLHSHAFQRGMAGLAERRSAHQDSFWTWRETMYAFLARLTPEDVEAIAAQAYIEMLEGGFTTVGEFHYLHHDPAGAPYDNPAEMAARIAAAAGTTGIGLTLLPVYYGQGGFGGVPPGEGQRRFVCDIEGFDRLLKASAEAILEVPDARLGIAPHSLRAVTPEALESLLHDYADGPVHIHAAEQVKEVEHCLAWSGLRPIEWLLQNVAIDRRWTIIHATHMTEEEIAGLARSGAVVGLCPVTEASLGDGIFEGVAYLGRGGRYGIGTDSNVRISLTEELSMLEYSQRLRDRGRNRMATRIGSTGRQLFEAALVGGAQALQRDIGAIAPGKRADLVTLDPEHPALVAAAGDALLDAWIFAGGKDCIREVRVGGKLLVREGRHISRDAVKARYRDAVRALVA